MNSKKFLTEKLTAESLLYFHSEQDLEEGRIETIAERWSNDALHSEKSRFDQLNRHIENCSQKRMLDMSSGCGSFVIQGLLRDWNLFGIEPEQWKQDLIDMKFKENDYPTEWRERIKQGIGEELPFEDDFFEAFNSWQTFEHVQDVSKCLTELYRVTQSGGKGVIHCPSYMTFYEGHYRLFWFPMMGNSSFAKFYLKLRKRPFDGLRTFVPIKRSVLTSKARQAGFEVENLTKKELCDAAKRKIPALNGALGAIGLPLIYGVWSLKQGLKRFGRTEKTIHLLLTKPN